MSLLVFLLASCSRAFARTPLLQEGKRTVYQRVVSHPNCKLWDGPLQSARELQELRTFTVLYIYGRSGERLEVGVSSKEADGWIDANSATEWPQAITMVFTDRTGRDPVLFFKDQKSLVSTCQAEQVKPLVNHYLEVFQKGGQEANFPIVASEPVKTSVAEKNFYLMPVFKYDTRFNDLKLLEVASIDPGSGEVHDKSK
ncbi:MAG: VWA domain-containing protein, partial [Desulfovibrio sp.]|nr:VWA domain-containing protein [Desulfovibrio sp.]